MKKIGSFLLLCAAIVCMTEAEDSEITKALKEHKIIPDVITESVPEILEVTFENGVTVDMGNELTPTQTRNQPTVEWDFDENSFYTIMLVDPDAPSADDPFNKELITWMVGNIPGNDIDSGDVLVEYVGSATPKGVGFNRYVILLYKQPGKLQFDEERINKFSFEGRVKFSCEKFASKYGLGSPIAANFYKTQFDLYVLYIYGQLQCCYELNKF